MTTTLKRERKQVWRVLKNIGNLLLIVTCVVGISMVVSLCLVALGTIFTGQTFAEAYSVYGWWVFGIISLICLILFGFILYAIGLLYDDPSMR